jgi:hypothetical protein
MAESRASFSVPHDHSLAVDFIENRLPKYHPLFRNPPPRYDRPTGHFVVASTASQPVTMQPTLGPHSALAASPPAPPVPAVGSVVKPSPEVAKTMSYWSMIFPKAMDEFTKMPGISPPKDREQKYDIRIEKSWEAVYDKLEAARDKYTKKTGFRGKARQVWRWTADNTTETLGLVIRLVPDIAIVTPVLGAVQVILEAVKRGADMREGTLDAFDELGDVFSDVELFLGTFKGEGGEESITSKAVGLVANVLLAVERGIGFFITPGCKF